MNQMISIREANQHLSRYIDLLAEGGEIIITRRGRPVAKLTPFSAANRLTPEQRSARSRTRSRMEKGYSLGGRRLKRDDLYER